MTEQTEAPAWTPNPPTRQLRVWTHVLNQVEAFDDAVAVMSDNGALTVWAWGSDARRGAVPIKGYAPGSWLTFEHVGEGYRPTFRDLTRTDTAGQRRAESEFVEQLPEPRLADPFVQLSPEALDDANSDVDGKTPTGTIPVPTRPGEDGEDAAFRQSADSSPLSEGGTAPDDDTPGPDDRSGSASGGPGRGVAHVRSFGRALRLVAGWLGLRFSALTSSDPIRLSRRPRWSDYDRAWIVLALTTAPMVAYLALSS